MADEVAATLRCPRHVGLVIRTAVMDEYNLPCPHPRCTTMPRVIAAEKLPWDASKWADSNKVPDQPTPTVEFQRYAVTSLWDGVRRYGWKKCS